MKKYPTIGHYLAVLLLPLLFFECSAYEVSVRSWLESKAAYDSNPRLRIDGIEDVVLSSNEIGSEARLERSTYNVSILPRLRFTRYTEETELNADDYFFNVNAEKYLERHQFSGFFEYERQASITTEVVDSAIFNVNLPRTTLAIGGSWSYLVSRNLTNTVSLSASDVTFEKDPVSPFVDYSVFGVGNTLSFSISESTRWLAILNISEFKAAAISLNTRSYSFQVGVEHQLYEDLWASLQVGQNISNTEFKSSQVRVVSISPVAFETFLEDGEDNSSGDVISFEAVKQFPRGLVRLKWSRAFSPASQGVRRNTQDVNAFGRYRWSEQLSSELRAFYRESKQEGDFTTQTINQVQLVTVTARTFWQFAKNWRLEGGLRFRNQIRINDQPNSDSFQPYFAIRFSPDEVVFDPY